MAAVLAGGGGSVIYERTAAAPDAAFGAEFVEVFAGGAWRRQGLPALRAEWIRALAVWEQGRQRVAAFDAMVGKNFEGFAGGRQSLAALEAVGDRALPIGQESWGAGSTNGTMLDRRMEKCAWRWKAGGATMAVVGRAFAVALQGEPGVTIVAVLDDMGGVGEVGLGGSDAEFDFGFLIWDLVGRGDGLGRRYGRFPLTVGIFDL